MRIGANGKQYPHSHCRDCNRAVQRECMRNKAKQTRMNFRMVPFGAASPNAKLTKDDVQNIRNLLEERAKMRDRLRHLSPSAIAEKFGISQRTVYAIAAQDRYTEVA